MAKASIDTGQDAQPVHTRTTAGDEESQVSVIGIDGSDSVVPADATYGLAVDIKRIPALTTTPSTSGDVSSGIINGRQTVATPGTPVAIRSALPCKWVLVTALKTNTSQVNVGGSGVLATLGGSTGAPLAAGESVSIPVDDASKVFIDARVALEGVSFMVGS